MIQNILLNKKLLHLSIIIAFAVVHIILSSSGLGSYYMNGGVNDMSLSDALHYSVITHTTIGFGDISPVNIIARAVTWCHALTVLLII